MGWKRGIEGAEMDVLAVSSEAVDGEGIAAPSGAISTARQKYVSSKTGGGRVRSVIGLIGSAQIAHSAVQVVRGKTRLHDLNQAIDSFRPDLIHALRLPYEGVTALRNVANNRALPVVVSSWGQDFDPQAKSDPILRWWLRRFLKNAAGFQYDSTSDLPRAYAYGLSRDVPTLHAAGNFGVDSELYNNRAAKTPGLVVYARKAVPSCNYYGFIEAALQLIQSTDATFVGVGLNHLLPEVIKRYGEFDQNRLRLVGQLALPEFAELVRSAQVIVSPSYSDGMPVTILGAFASGSRIVAGDLPQLRELVAQGADITLVDARSSSAIARGIEDQLAPRAEASGTELPQQYSRQANANRVRAFYDRVLSTASQ